MLCFHTRVIWSMNDIAFIPIFSYVFYMILHDDFTLFYIICHVFCDSVKNVFLKMPRTSVEKCYFQQICRLKITLLRSCFWRFLKIHFIPISGREGVTFYEFYMILNKVLKMYMPCYRNLTHTLHHPDPS